MSGFGCSGKSIEVKRNDTGVYEVKFSGNPDKNAVGAIVDIPKLSSTRLAPGDFTVLIPNAAIKGGEDRPFRSCCRSH